MKRVSLLVVTSLLAAAVATGVVAGCSGDAPIAADGGAPSATATGTGTTPIPDASVKDTSAPDTSVPDTSVPDTSVPPVTWNPTGLPGLALWLDPSSGVTEVAGKVSAWADRSASAIKVVQAATANQPTKGTVGGKPVLAFSETTWLAAAAADVGVKLDFALGDVTVMVVCSTEGNSSQPLTGLLYKLPDNAASPYDGLQVYGNLGGNGKPGAGLAGVGPILTAAAGTTADTKLHLLTFQRAGTKLALRMDGIELATMAVAPKNVDSVSPLQVGGRAALTHNANHKLGDVLIYKATVSDSDLAMAEGWIRAKNGI